MNVILLEKIGKLGELGDQVVVSSGYGRNYLLPTGKAIMATQENIAKVEEKRAELELAQNEALSRAKARADILDGLRLTIKAKVGEENKLYGSVGTQEISAAIKSNGIDVEKKEILMPNGSIRDIGEHLIDIRLHPDVDVVVTLEILNDND